ncbi:MAG: acetylornithine deacetylase [Flavobacteriaceae bacterium]|jgi:acetylornithine deacetylase
MKEHYQEALRLLKQLIATPSFSKEEDKTATIIADWLNERGVEVMQSNNNVWAKNEHFSYDKPTVLLNSHHDTVQANVNYSLDPFHPKEEDGKLFGLGSNDAGGAVVSLLATFMEFYSRIDLKYNLLIAITAEEEISGQHGIASLFSELPDIEFAIVGEPTEMNLAIAEKGLMVIDGCATGISGHAAHTNTENPIYTAMKDLEWISNFQFDRNSSALGKVKMSVSQINAGKQHNLIPGACDFVIDVRVNDQYSNQEVFEIINENTVSKLTPRSFRLNSSSIDQNHPIVLAGLALGKTTFGSPTLSDQALISCPSLKIGPGKTERSHTADEFIYLHEIKEGIEIYIELIEKLNSYEIVG